MKKLFIIAIAGLFTFASCGKKAVEPATEPVQTEQECEKKCELTEEQKAEMEAWANWDSQTDERKAELVANKKACLDKCMAEKAEKCEGETEKCPEKEAKCAEMKAKLDNWDNLTIDEKKALLDEFAPKKCCKGEGHEGGEGCCKGEGHEGCQGHEQK